jgi:hypothetical protein
MSVDEHMNDNEQERRADHGHSQRLNPSPVPTAIVREVAAGLKSLVKVMPYEEYARVVYRIARVRWHCELAAAYSPLGDESM